MMMPLKMAACEVVCNDGYMLPSRINNYETCGPTTGYTWSFKLKDPEAGIPSCIVIKV